MDRRKALKNIGTGLGAIVVTPTVVSMFQSCQSAPTYTTVFFPSEDFETISNLMELIIPKTDIPGAIELKLPEFTDAYVDAVWDDQGKERLIQGWDAFKQAGAQSVGKEDASQLSIEQWDALLAKYLKPGNEVPEEEKDAAEFAGSLRSLTVNAFKTNEYIGENILAYAPIPGEQKGCVDLMETTGGKAWSL
ncbi:MAG: gluconate 2-dehydrogenase subunit 3 family protein [Flavobacteriaceae bacterium]